MKWFDNTSLTIVIIGAVNWLLIGIFRFDPLQAHLRGAKVVSLNPKGDIFPLGKAVVAFLELAL